MKKITLFDSVRKFTGDIVEHWESQGHSVVIDRYWDASKVANSDVAFFEFVDNSLMRASDPNDSMYKEMGLTRPTGKKIIARCHDIDAWCGNHMRIQWDFVTDLVFVAKHIQDKVLSEIKLPKNVNVHLIKHGINLDKFTFREKPINKKITFIGNINDSKRMETCLLILSELPRDYILYILGGGLTSWRESYVKYYIKENNLNVLLINHVDSVNDFLQDKDFLILPSEKEAFSFAVGESMAVGVKPIIHNFLGSKNIWPEHLIWNTVSEAKQLILEDRYESKLYRSYIEVNYPLDKMLKQYDEIIN